ncbi:RNA polymerase sigma factor SigJ [Pelagicoccus sp. SDUM812002]|uniref:RNA polymerase sigma factor SigJ n=1 Tax=Pelagicoccus sp. SDUM812002 TaxID=3041266 RepID=UPI00280EFC4C|nr:RNA polymerase sigma factor SigJ [Pelagicoccus sp. SDUM812002]MDQ8186257.1 RNA polymerase sigma factor SigJ [Pelagicoccus sp. SDUM812002]
MADSLETAIETHRSSIEGLAYRMLGSRVDAQDIAQESLLKWHQLDEQTRTAIREPLAWLHTVASRLAIDHLKSAQRQRETYIGPWLPEPLLITETTPADLASIDDSITFALLHAMERLTPTERAAFILHDVFDYPFATIAQILQKEVSACRQLASRARQALKANRPKSNVAPEAHQKLLEAFIQAAAQGDESGLEAILAEDAILYSDGGSLAKAVRKPLRSRELITRLFVGLSRKARKSGDARTAKFTRINSQPSALIFTNGVIDTVFTIEIHDRKIQTLYQQRNPEKIRFLQERFPTAEAN